MWAVQMVKGQSLKTDAETLVWVLAGERYGDDMIQIVVRAIKSFKRRPGLDGLTWVYGQAIGTRGLKVLIEALSDHAAGRFHIANGGVEIRVALRSHLLWCLRQKLVDDGHAPARMRDEHFASDLGL